MKIPTVEEAVERYRDAAHVAVRVTAQPDSTPEEIYETTSEMLIATWDVRIAVRTAPPKAAGRS